MVTPESRHVYWKYALRVDDRIPGGADQLGARLKESGVFCAPRYIRKLAFECEVLRDRRTFGKSEFPFKGPHREGLPEVVYDRSHTPGAVEALRRVVVLPINERYTPEHIDHVASVIRTVAEELSQ